MQTFHGLPDQRTECFLDNVYGRRGVGVNLKEGTRRIFHASAYSHN